MNTIEAVKSAPRANSDFASAAAAYEHDEDTIPKNEALPDRAGPVITQGGLHPSAGDERLHRPGQAEPQHQRPQGFPEHRERLIQAVPDRTQHPHRRLRPRSGRDRVSRAGGGGHATARRVSRATNRSRPSGPVPQSGTPRRPARPLRSAGACQRGARS